MIPMTLIIPMGAMGDMRVMGIMGDTPERIALSGRWSKPMIGRGAHAPPRVAERALALRWRDLPDGNRFPKRHPPQHRNPGFRRGRRKQNAKARVLPRRPRGERLATVEVTESASPNQQSSIQPSKPPINPFSPVFCLLSQRLLSLTRPPVHRLRHGPDCRHGRGFSAGLGGGLGGCGVSCRVSGLGPLEHLLAVVAAFRRKRRAGLAHFLDKGIFHDSTVVRLAGVQTIGKWRP